MAGKDLLELVRELQVDFNTLGEKDLVAAARELEISRERSANLEAHAWLIDCSTLKCFDEEKKLRSIIVDRKTLRVNVTDKDMYGADMEIIEDSSGTKIMSWSLLHATVDAAEATLSHRWGSLEEKDLNLQFKDDKSESISLPTRWLLVLAAHKPEGLVWCDVVAIQIMMSGIKDYQKVAHCYMGDLYANTITYTQLGLFSPDEDWKYMNRGWVFQEVTFGQVRHFRVPKLQDIPQEEPKKSEILQLLEPYDKHVWHKLVQASASAAASRDPVIAARLQAAQSRFARLQHLTGMPSLKEGAQTQVRLDTPVILPTITTEEEVRKNLGRIFACAYTRNFFDENDVPVAVFGVASSVLGIKRKADEKPTLLSLLYAASPFFPNGYQHICGNEGVDVNAQRKANTSLCGTSATFLCDDNARDYFQLDSAPPFHGRQVFLIGKIAPLPGEPKDTFKLIFCHSVALGEPRLVAKDRNVKKITIV